MSKQSVWGWMREAIDIIRIKQIYFPTFWFWKVWQRGLLKHKFHFVKPILLLLKTFLGNPLWIIAAGTIIPLKKLEFEITKLQRGIFDHYHYFFGNHFCQISPLSKGLLHLSNVACPISDIEQYFMQKSGLCSVDLLKWLLGISFIRQAVSTYCTGIFESLDICGR